MEYKRLKRQLKIHWQWIKNIEDPEEVYKILKVWVDTSVKIQKEQEVMSESSLKKDWLRPEEDDAWEDL